MEHTVRAYDEELDTITAELSRMGGLAEAEVVDAVRAIARSDVALAEAVIARDERLDELEADIERKVIRLIALRQPVADDLRRAVAAMKISMNLERCGDLAKNIAKRCLAIIESEPLDAAVVDLNLNGQFSYPVADALAARGAPFVFSSGYSQDRLLEKYRGFPILQKPFHRSELAEVLAKLLTPRSKAARQQ